MSKAMFVQQLAGDILTEVPIVFPNVGTPEEAARLEAVASPAMLADIAYRRASALADLISSKFDPATLAEVGYKAYARKTGGKTFDGRDMPEWKDIPERIQGAWASAALAIMGQPEDFG